MHKPQAKAQVSKVPCRQHRRSLRQSSRARRRKPPTPTQQASAHRQSGRAATRRRTSAGAGKTSPECWHNSVQRQHPEGSWTLRVLHWNYWSRERKHKPWPRRKCATPTRFPAVRGSGLRTLRRSGAKPPASTLACPCLLLLRHGTTLPWE